MAFDDSKVSLVGYGAGQKVFIYYTTDTINVVRAANYFRNTGEATLIKANDIILSVYGSGGTVGIDVFAVQTISATASAVTVTARS